MAKLTLSDITDLQNESTVVSAINANNALVEVALENTLSRDGTSPNTMVGVLDMNSNQIYNLPAAIYDTSPVRKSEFDQAVLGTGDGNVVGPAGATAGNIAVFSGSTGHVISEITKIPVTQGGTNATTASAARTSLGLAIGTDVQAFDSDLAAVAGLAATGLIARTATGTASARTLTGTSGQLTITNGDGVSGNPTFTIGAIPCFSVHKNGSDQTGIADITPTAVTWGTEIFDIGSYFTSNTWTPPAGKVFLQAAARCTGTLSVAAVHKIMIYKNGALFRQSQPLASVTTEISMSVSSIDVATGTDAYTIQIYIDTTSGTGTVKGTATDTWFNGHWISP